MLIDDFVSPAFFLSVRVCVWWLSLFILLFSQAPCIVSRSAWLRLSLGLTTLIAALSRRALLHFIWNYSPASRPLTSFCAPWLPFCIWHIACHRSLISLERNLQNRDNKHTFLLVSFYMLAIISMVLNNYWYFVVNSHFPCSSYIHCAIIKY